MEGHIYNAAVLQNEKEGFARSVSQSRERDNLDNKVGKMDPTEFLLMISGAGIIGTSIYFLSFFI